MLVAIAGGALQGLEMTYLARKAGFETLLLDRQSDAPATGICDRFDSIDLTDHDALTGALGSVDLVLIRHFPKSGKQFGFAEGA